MAEDSWEGKSASQQKSLTEQPGASLDQLGSTPKWVKINIDKFLKKVAVGKLFTEEDLKKELLIPGESSFNFISILYESAIKNHLMVHVDDGGISFEKRLHIESHKRLPQDEKDRKFLQYLLSRYKEKDIFVNGFRRDRAMAQQTNTQASEKILAALERLYSDDYLDKVSEGHYRNKSEYLSENESPFGKSE